jgi:hypothetical protein
MNPRWHPSLVNSNGSSSASGGNGAIATTATGSAASGTVTAPTARSAFAPLSSSPPSSSYGHGPSRPAPQPPSGATGGMRGSTSGKDVNHNRTGSNGSLLLPPSSSDGSVHDPFFADFLHSPSQSTSSGSTIARPAARSAFAADHHHSSLSPTSSTALSNNGSGQGWAVPPEPQLTFTFSGLSGTSSGGLSNSSGSSSSNGNDATPMDSRLDNLDGLDIPHSMPLSPLPFSLSPRGGGGNSTGHTHAHGHAGHAAGHSGHASGQPQLHSPSNFLGGHSSTHNTATSMTSAALPPSNGNQSTTGGGGSGGGGGYGYYGYGPSYQAPPPPNESSFGGDQPTPMNSSPARRAAPYSRAG